MRNSVIKQWLDVMIFSPHGVLESQGTPLVQTRKSNFGQERRKRRRVKNRVSLEVGRGFVFAQPPPQSADNQPLKEVKMMSSVDGLVTAEQFEGAILLVRGRRVLLDAQLAELYGVETRVLLQAVKRNATRFPCDFMFQLTQSESGSLRSQTVISKQQGGRRYQPFAFTEQGVAMLSSVLRSSRAIQVNIAIMRAFVHMREMVGTHEDMARRIDELESRFDGQFKTVFEAIRSLMSRPDLASKTIGFRPDSKK